MLSEVALLKYSVGQEASYTVREKAVSRFPFHPTLINFVQATNLPWIQATRPHWPTMSAHPLIAPVVAPGCWPGATIEEKQAELYKLKQQRWVAAGMESCISKGILSAGVGTY